MARGKSPSDNTIRMLCGKSAGMCEFEGCNKRLFYDNVTLAQFNNAFVAHIVASSPNGPRGDKVLSSQLSDKLENLMLMCADHHKLIDTNVDEYPVERLKAMKAAHEEKLERICSLFNVPKTEIVRFASPIKGTQAANIDYNLAAKAVLPNKYPASSYGIQIPIKSSYKYKSKEYWDDCTNQLEFQFQNALYNPYIQLHRSNFSIFPIAPIPLIIKLGELIGDKLPCDVYQKTRVPDTWEWQSVELTNTFAIGRKEYNQESENIALIISLTNEILDDRIPRIDEYRAIYKITASELGVDCIKSISDLSAFWHTYQSVCEDILNLYGRNVGVHLFPAVPVSVAFEIGRRYMTNTYPKISIYDECDGFFETLVLGG